MDRSVPTDDVPAQGGDADTLKRSRAPIEPFSAKLSSRVRNDPLEVLRRGQTKARSLARCIGTSEDRLAFAQSFCTQLIGSYWRSLPNEECVVPDLPRTKLRIPTVKLDGSGLAHTMGQAAARLDVLQASYLVGVTYTAMIPSGLRSKRGVFYTPPALVTRLMEMAENAGVNWRTARVLDPACGGGAFLAPVARRMAQSMADCEPDIIVRSIGERLQGFEIDPFSAWMSQVFVEAEMLQICRASGLRLPRLVTICDTLRKQPDGRNFDLVIGNPPYGRVTLTPLQRAHYRRGLFGHANLYGVFTDIALRWTGENGVVAYVTPTSILAGEYFKALRALLSSEAPPKAIDLVAERKGIFDDVLQETFLATYCRRGRARGAKASIISVRSDNEFEIVSTGNFVLPDEPTAPWLLPRTPEHAQLVERMREMPHRLSDYGYKVSTGPLVWNRHKAQLRDHPSNGAYPLIWAEAVTQDGRFEFRSEKKNHKPYFQPNGEADDWLLVRKPCVLIQRTTAKEQHRRLIAAELPARFIATHSAVVVENHLNMIRPTKERPRISTKVLAAFLNSEIVDQAFRCINGSVAVSAFELEELPLPSPGQIKVIESLVRENLAIEKIRSVIRDIYLGKIN